MEAAVPVVVHVKPEPLHHLLYQVLGLEVVDLVLKVGLGLEQPHVGELVGANGVALALVLDQDLGRAAVDIGRAEQPEVCHAYAYGHGQEYPGPVAQGHEDDVEDRYGPRGRGLGAGPSGRGSGGGGF